MLASVGPQDRVQRAIVDVLHPSNAQTVEIDTIKQSYFEDLIFLTVDTGVVSVDSAGHHYVHPIRSYGPFRIAVDEEGRVYRLFGFDSVEYDQLIYRYPETEVMLDPSAVSDYGRFFIETTMLSNRRGDYYFVEGSNWFVGFNRKMMIDDFTRFVNKRLQELEDRMKELSPYLNFDTLKFDRRTNSYIVDYYVWFALTGELRHICLKIELDGACIIGKDEILAERLGAYDLIRDAYYPPEEK